MKMKRVLATVPVFLYSYVSYFFKNLKNSLFFL